MKHFTEIGPGGDVFVALSGLGGFNALVVLAVERVVGHFSRDFELGVGVAGRDQLTGHFPSRLVGKDRARTGLRGVGVRFVGVGLHRRGGSDGHVGDALDVVTAEGGGSDLAGGLQSDVDLAGVEILRTVSGDGQLELGALKAAGIEAGRVHLFAGTVEPGEVDFDVVPVLNDDVDELAVVGGVSVDRAVHGDFDHVLALRRRPHDVGTAALEGQLAAAEEGACGEWVGGGIKVADGAVVAHGVNVFPHEVVSGGVLGDAANSLGRVGQVNGDRVGQLVDVRIAHVLDEGRERDLFTHLEGVAATSDVARAFFRRCDGNHRRICSCTCAGFLDYHLFFKLVDVHAGEETRQHQQHENYRCHILHVNTPEGSVSLPTPCVVFILWAL